jgi:hypothetical protein
MKILSLLFTTNIDTTPIPDNNKFILGISSLWILTLIHHSLLFSYLFSINILLISIISPIFWYKYQLNSIYHKLDKLLVWSIALLNLKYALNKLYFFVSIYLLLLTIFFYYLSDYFTIKKKFKYQLISHLLFRYFFFLWIYLTIADNYDNLSLISIGYFSHNYYLSRNIIKYNLYNYIYYLTQILFFIIII